MICGNRERERREDGGGETGHVKWRQSLDPTNTCIRTAKALKAEDASRMCLYILQGEHAHVSIVSKFLFVKLPSSPLQFQMKLLYASKKIMTQKLGGNGLN